MTDLEVFGRWLVEAAHARASADEARLLAYAAAETPTGDREALDGFLGHVAADVAARLPSATSRVIPTVAGDVLVVDLPGAGAGAGLAGDEAPAGPGGEVDAPAVLLAHHDTVHPVGSLVGAVPLRREGHVLHGPGVYDMKGGLVAALTALELLSEAASLGLVSHRPVRLISTPDEEVGSPVGGAVVLAETADARYVLGLEPPHPGGGLKTARRGSTRWRITAQGRAAHAALDPEAGVNAIEALLDALEQVRAIAVAHPEVLINIGTVTGGGRTNVVPDAASADLGLRFADAASERAVLAALSALARGGGGDGRGHRVPGAVVTSAALTRRPTWMPGAASGELLARVAVAGLAVGQVVEGGPAAGAADTNLTGAAGTPSLDGFGLLGAGAHAVHEHIDLRSLPERVSLIAAVLATM